MTHRGPFQPLLFCDSVILWKFPLPSCTFFCEPFPPRTHRFCSVTGAAPALVGQWAGVGGRLRGCSRAAAGPQLSLPPCKLRRRKSLGCTWWQRWLSACCRDHDR